MSKPSSIEYKIADSQEELEQIHRLNYETFVEEIPQHAGNESRKLIDRFHDENTYWIAKQDGRLIGMLAIRGNRPFSLDEKLGDISKYLPEGTNPCEIRLLAVRSDFRGNRTFFELLERVVPYSLQQGYDCAVISGTTRQTRLYQHLGFQPFGPLISSGKAKFQPMLLTKEQFLSAGKLFRDIVEPNETVFPICLLPGPVSMHPTVQEAWSMPAVSHRSEQFCRDMADLQKTLKDMTGSTHVQVAVGTGTMANDLVAAQLSQMSGKGLVLSSGEFGERLAGHAVRWNLRFVHLQKQWNEPCDLDEIKQLLEEDADIRWIWTVHCETSTGYLYPVEELKSLCREQDMRLCLDACSSVGTVPVDFSDVYLASAVSGKGLGSYPGIAIVFHQQEVVANNSLPAFLDLGMYSTYGSVPFTHSSNGLAALRAAVACHALPDMSLVNAVRKQLTRAGLAVLGNETYSPGIITIELSSEQNSRIAGDRLKSMEIEISYESGYLLKRNWIQLAFMGHHDAEQVRQAVSKMTSLLTTARRM